MKIYSRELFLETMKFNRNVRTLKWEFGYWGETIDNWYKEGLPLKYYPKIEKNNILFTSGSLYSNAWNHNWNNKIEKLNNDQRNKMPKGIGVLGGFIFYPNQGFPLAPDVSNFFNLDNNMRIVEVEQFFYPQFKIEILNEDNKSFTYIDIDGVTRKYLKESETIPTSLNWPIKDWSSWLEIKEQRLNPNNISKRFPSDWSKKVKEYKNRDYALTISGYPFGMFGTLAHLIGYDNLFYFYYDEPKLLKDILESFTNLWISIWEEILSYTDVDMCNIWEDVSDNKGSMVSPRIFKEFMAPYYNKITSFLKSKKINTILVDTDGNCEELIPLFLDTGITGIYPMEANVGMDIVSIRKKYPDLQIMGGIPKFEINKGSAVINEILEIVSLLIKSGGYIPFCDHLIPPEISWDNFKYYREKLNSIIEKNVQ